MKKKTVTYLICILTLLSTSTWAERINRIQLEADDNWTNQNNWVYTSGLAPSGIPKASDIVRITKGAKVRVTTEVNVGSVHISSDGSGVLIIDGGTFTATIPNEYNSAGNRPSGSIIVENGGKATLHGRVLVGLKNAPTGAFIVKKGSVRVPNIFIHNEGYTGTEAQNTRTTVYSEGLLDVDRLQLNSGVLDVAGGTVVVRQDVAVQINQWVEDGRIIAMSGVDGWHIKVTVDAETGWTTIVAEEESITLG